MNRLALLSKRERVVLRHLMEGCSVQEIARVEFVSVYTVHSQLAAVRRKFGVQSQHAAVALAYQECWPVGDDIRETVTNALSQGVVLP